ncbi:MAG TPA: hypothetical protein VFH99_03270 [Candidatus Saccharimonadales bacterium]|nr:hypothetical protein [Candidatus Saccharimonadales bacterium]
MAGSAELLKQPTDPFDWDLAETQFAQDQPQRPAESEIYGRSLGTILRLGAFAVDKSHEQIINSPEAEQAKAEFFTSVEEGFGTDMELGGGLEVRDIDERPVSDDGRVLAKDLKTPISDMTKAGLACAIETAKKDERFESQLVRSEWDNENALITDDMAQGKTNYNTRIVPTLYPKEAAAKSGHKYWRDVGYVPHLERGFIQLYYAGEDGFISGSLSFDGSDINRLREVFAEHGVHIPEDEVTDNCLQYAITGTMSEEQAKELALDLADQLGDPKYKKTANTVEITSEHRAIMDMVFNESYVHACESLSAGYQTAGARQLISRLADKAQNFNRDYEDALYKMRSDEDHFGDEEAIVLHELLVYSTIEMMRAFHLQATEPGAKNSSFFNIGHLDVAHLQSLDAASFQSMLGGFGADGARNNRTYSACGLAISLGGTSNPSESPQHAFGGKTCPEVKNGQITRCPHCKKTVKAIVPNKEKIYCSNSKCKLAAPNLTHKSEKQVAAD